MRALEQYFLLNGGFFFRYYHRTNYKIFLVVIWHLPFGEDLSLSDQTIFRIQDSEAQASRAKLVDIFTVLVSGCNKLGTYEVHRVRTAPPAS